MKAFLQCLHSLQPLTTHRPTGLPPLPIHSLRHTHTVLQLEAGAEMKYVQERLGHGSIQITSDIFANISKKIEMNNMEKYESFTEKLFR
nr:tyrosine-type recombinase/integrase [Paenibacillus terrae]